MNVMYVIEHYNITLLPDTGGSRHFTGRGHINADIRLEGQFSMFPSISRLFLLWRGPKSIAKLDGGPWPDFHPLDPPMLPDIYLEGK